MPSEPAFTDWIHPRCPRCGSRRVHVRVDAGVAHCDNCGWEKAFDIEELASDTDHGPVVAGPTTRRTPCETKDK